MAFADVVFQIEEKDSAGIDVLDELVISLHDGGIMRRAGLGEFEDEKGIFSVDRFFASAGQVFQETGSFYAVGHLIKAAEQIHNRGKDIRSDNRGRGVSVWLDTRTTHEEGDADTAFANVIFVAPLGEGFVIASLVDWFPKICLRLVAIVGGVKDKSIVTIS